MIALIRQELYKLQDLFTNRTFIFLTVVGNGLLVAATLAFYAWERGHNPNVDSYFDALWWGIATITTVAYGDIVPVTLPGRLVGIVLMYTGTVLFVSFTGVLLTLLMKEQVESELAPLERGLAHEEAEQIRIEKMLQRIQLRLDHIEAKLPKS